MQITEFIIEFEQWKNLRNFYENYVILFKYKNIK